MTDRASTVRPRVVVVGKAAPERGGIASYIGQLMTGPLQEGFDLLLCNLTRPERGVGGRLSFRNVTRTAADVGLVWRASRGADVVHVHTAAAPLVTLARAGVLAAVARARGARVLLHAHGGRVGALPTGRGTRLLVAVLLFAVTRVVTVSRRGEEVLRPLLGERLTFLPNGVDTERFRPRERRDVPGPPVVLYAGALTPRKGILDLLEASRRLHDEGVDHLVRLVGGTSDDGRDAEAQVLRATELAGADAKGAVAPERMPQIYAEADVFCLPSWWEAMPLTVLEAMASGLPVVATEVGDVPNLVVEGTGQLVPVRDTAALQHALRTYLTDAARREVDGTAGRERAVRHHSLDDTMRRLGAIYQELAS